MAYLECANWVFRGLGVGSMGKAPIGGLGDFVRQNLKLFC